MNNPLSDSLLLSARSGSQQALGRLLDHYRPWLKGKAQAVIAPVLATKLTDSDIVQKTFLQAVKHFADFRGTTILEFRAWLASILNRQLVDASRQYQAAQMRNIYRELSLSKAESIAERTAETESPSEEQIAALLVAIDQLPEVLRNIVRLRYLEGQSLDAIASEVDTPRESVRRRLKEALAILVHRMQDF